MMVKKKTKDETIKFVKEGDEFEVGMGKDTFKLLLRVNVAYPQHVMQAIAKGMVTNQIVIIPPKIDVIVVKNDGTVEVH